MEKDEERGRKMKKEEERGRTMEKDEESGRKMEKEGARWRKMKNEEERGRKKRSTTHDVTNSAMCDVSDCVRKLGTHSRIACLSTPHKPMRRTSH